MTVLNLEKRKNQLISYYTFCKKTNYQLQCILHPGTDGIPQEANQNIIKNERVLALISQIVIKVCMDTPPTVQNDFKDER